MKAGDIQLRLADANRWWRTPDWPGASALTLGARAVFARCARSCRKKQDRAKAAAERAEQERRRAKAASRRQSAERYDQLSDPSASPARIAEILAAELPERVLAADMMRLRMSLGVPTEEVTQTARLLLERTAPEPPGIGALAVAALAAHLAGDEDAEHGYARELLARADASRDPGQRLEVVRSATGRDHPGETCELIEPYLREHPDDELATDIYARALAKAHAQAEPGELETAALDRYRDRSGVDALDRAVDEFTERTPWGAIIRKWLDKERAGQKTERWLRAEQDTTDALMAEIAVFFPSPAKRAMQAMRERTTARPIPRFGPSPRTRRRRPSLRPGRPSGTSMCGTGSGRWRIPRRRPVCGAPIWCPGCGGTPSSRRG